MPHAPVCAVSITRFANHGLPDSTACPATIHGDPTRATGAFLIRTSRRLNLVTLGLLGCVLLAPAAAHATAAMSIAPSFPTPLTVGSTNVPASVVVTNNNTSLDHALQLCNVGDVSPCTGEGITLQPSCGMQDVTLGCATPDPGVFAVNTTAVGAAGSDCAGKQFTVAAVGSSGKLRFTPTVDHVVLPMPGSFCRINFTIDVLSFPKLDTAPAAGLQTIQIAEGVGVSDQGLATFGRGQSAVTVKGAPRITTNPSTGSLGGQLTDSATLVDEYNPAAGSVTFRLYGPGDTTCTDAVFTSSVSINPDGTAISAGYTVPLAGTYRWVASYSGDANNNDTIGACNSPGETVVIAKATPSMQTTASPDVAIGGNVTDSATLIDAYNPTGDVTFRLYEPDDTRCSAAVFTSPGSINPDGTATSAAFTPTSAGTYRWVASYVGDPNNDAVIGACSDPGATVVIAKATPTMQTTASADVAIGEQVTDSATLIGEHNPTGGEVTFRIYGPADAGCSGSPAFLSKVKTNLDGTVTSAPFTPAVAGTYRWIATYGGDVNNQPTASACNDSGQAVAVTKRSPGLLTNASASVPVGGAITDSATLTGEAHPTGGDVTFRLYGADDANCSGVPVAVSTVAINADGTATSQAYAASAPGTYQWVASYGGDVNHEPAAGACNEPHESVTVTKASPSIVTHASGSVAVGGQITDSATLAGEFGQTEGNVTFRLYGSEDATCSATVAFQSTVTVNGDGTATSEAFSPSSPGTYRWVASYAGDAHNDPAAGACDDPGENVTVTKASPSITTNASPTVPLGGAMTDAATLTGEINPTGGSVTFRLYGPGGTSCSGATVFESTVAINGDGSATSAAFTATAAGTYRWIASYSGDANNAPASGGCNDPNEAVVVAAASPTIVTKASGDVEVGDAVTDAAALAGEVNPTAGNVTFKLYGPENATCTGAAIFQSTVAINADGTAKSSRFVPTAPGTYRWVADYGGDANNGPASGACNEADESVTVTVGPSPLLCGKGLALVDVFPEGSRMLISGVARPSYAGKRAQIVLGSTRKTVASALIGTAGGFAVTAKLPVKRLRAKARYHAIVDGVRSVGLKLMRRSYLTRAAVRGDKATFAGKVTGKFRAGATVTLLKITQCKKNTTAAATKLKRNGTWQITIALPDSVPNLLFRAKTNVLTDGRPNQTFTLPRPLSLSAAP